jgi:hypothetical protein
MSWLSVLRHAPVILSTAEALFQKAKSSRADDATQNLEARLDELADASRASAEVVQEMARQLQALAVNYDRAARRVRVAMGFGIAATAIAIVALAIALAR